MQTPPAVTVATPLAAQVTDWDDYTGRFEASKAVDIRPRVSGQLVGLHFHDGDIVHQGQLLFTIDPRPFNAALAQANAQVASAATALSLARADFARASRLVSEQAVSAEEIDSLKARVQSAQAQLTAAQALVTARKLDVEFTQVRSPITGRVSDRRVDVGNLVAGDSAANATVLTTVRALEPIYFTFEGSEGLYLKQLRQHSGGAKGQQVEIRLQDETGYNWHGTVDFTDNTMDNGSGTIRGRAVVANPANFLVPGMFGSMRLSVGAAHQALLVPDAAVVTDQARKVVYTVAKDGTVNANPVVTGALVNGLRVVRQGLSGSDRVVIQGMQYAQPGTVVQTAAGKVEQVKDTTAPAVVIPAASQATLVTAVR